MQSRPPSRSSAAPRSRQTSRWPGLGRYSAQYTLPKYPIVSIWVLDGLEETSLTEHKTEDHGVESLPSEAEQLPALHHRFAADVHVKEVATEDGWVGWGKVQWQHFCSYTMSNLSSNWTFCFWSEGPDSPRQGNLAKGL